ncbi:MAG TPA: hypothetical protein PKA00_14130 [Saprospiraceae bacterium]|nr:hypothetical protein [Saprospiraceae bacterium]HMQ84050.1 hypothetical protein [Saprospiraceae bacterium]
MAQFVWTYVNDSGKRYQVGLYHGDQSGHLVVHCNSSVVLIDFNVLETKIYPLFLDEDLFDLTIEKKDGQFRYGFELNKKADIPSNQERKTRDKKHWKQTLLFFGGMLILVFGILFFMLHVNKRQNVAAKESLLEGAGITTVAHIDHIITDGPQLTLFLSFVANNQAIRKQLIRNSDFPGITPFGMPLNAGDEFQLRYLRGNDSVWELQLEHPTEQQIARYRELAIAKHSENTPQLLPESVNCLVELAYELKGLAGIADFYAQKLTPEENPYANELTYKRLIRDVPFQKRAEEQCW